MTRPLRYFSLAIALAVGLAACKAPRPPAEQAPAAVAAPAPEPVAPAEPEVVGRVLIVGADDAFVVFQTEPGQSVATGQVLDIRFAGSTVGSVKVDPPKENSPSPKLHVADVLKGKPEKGYELVRQVSSAP